VLLAQDVEAKVAALLAGYADKLGVTASAKASSDPLLSAILPPYARRSKSLEVLIPVLYRPRRAYAVRDGDGAHVSDCVRPQGCERP
jgi:hypothetical protein